MGKQTFTSLVVLFIAVCGSTAEAQPSRDLDPGVALELADLDRRGDSAAALYGSSVALLVTGAVGTGIAPLVGTALSRGDTFDTAAWISFTTIGSVCLVGHLITLITAISIDVGAGARSGRLHRANPTLIRLTPGAGDVGVGLALDFF